MQGALTKQDDKTDDPPPEEQEITEEQIRRQTNTQDYRPLWGD